MLKGYGISLAEYRRMSLYARFSLHRSVSRHREALYGSAETDPILNPEED